MALTEKEIVICNQSLLSIGAEQFTLANQASNVQGEKCNLFYSQTRQALLRSFEWNFASKRKILTSSTTPDFGYDYQFKLPDDFLRLKTKGLYSGDPRVIEGEYLLTDDDAPEIKYIRNVEDPDEFDPLFTEVLILTLAKKLIPTIAGTKSESLTKDVARDLKDATKRAKAVCGVENDLETEQTSNEARYGFEIT